MSWEKQEVRIFIPWFLPAFRAGGPVQTIANLVAQEEEGLRYRVICSDKDLDKTGLNVQKNTWLPWNRWTTICYSSRGTNRSLYGSENDILFINGIYSWQFNLRPVLFARAGRKIVSPRGMLHAGALSQKAAKKKLYLLFWKLARLHQKVEFHATNPTEEKEIRNVFGHNVKVHLAANLPRTFTLQSVPHKKPGELHLVSIALLSPMKNILMVLQALKELGETVTYEIFGPVKDAAYWSQCQALSRNLPSNITVRYNGDLHPSKVEEALEQAHVFILPSRSENFGHAIYEALTAGKPVITSETTPWNGLEKARAGRNVSLTGKDGLVEAIRFFAAMTGEDLEEWSRGASTYAESALDIGKIKQQYREMFGPPVIEPPPGTVSTTS